jgi:hypothetical protein
LHDRADGFRLRHCQAALSLRSLADQRAGIEMATLRREDKAVPVTVECIALLEDAVDEQPAIRIAQRRPGLRFTRGVARRDRVERHGRMAQTQVREAGACGGRGRDDAIEVVGEPLRHQHRFAAAGGTADEIVVAGRFAVAPGDDALRHRRHVRHGLIEEVQRSLLVGKEGSVEPGGLVTGIGTRHGEAARQRRHIRGVSRTDRWLHAPVETATALKEKPAVPVHRQGDGEAYAIGLSVPAGARIDDAIDSAMSRNCGCHAGRARRNIPRWLELDFSIRPFESGEIDAARALGCRPARKHQQTRSYI